MLERVRTRDARSWMLQQRWTVSAGLLLVALLLIRATFQHEPVPRPPAAPPRENVPHDPNYIVPSGLVFHESASSTFIGRFRVNAAYLERMHAAEHPTWATEFEGKTYHIGYHYVILPDGTVQKGRPDHCVGCHAIHYNMYLGICMVGAFSRHDNPRWRPSRPTSAQLYSLIALSERLMLEYHITPDRIKRHGDVEDTYCPGNRFPYQDVMKELRAFAVLHPELRVAPGRGAHTAPLV